MAIVFLLCYVSAVKVTPRSVKHTNSKEIDCNFKEPMSIPERKLQLGEKIDITYSYSVKFVV